MKNKIFINYRRSDTSAEAQNLHSSLSKIFGKSSVFLDVHDIPAGENWVDALKDSGAAAKVLLVLIGDKWLEQNEKGKCRLENPKDWVRKEIETALKQNLVAIPVLFDQVSMPEKDNLPESIRNMTDCNAISIRHDSFHQDVNRLVKEIEPHVDSTFKIFYRQNKRVISIIAAILLVFIAAMGLKSMFTPTSAEPCPTFDEDKDIKTLIFSTTRDADVIVEYIDDEFRERCKTRFRNQNHAYSFHDFDASGDFHERAKLCQADIFIVPKASSIDDAQVEFGYVDPQLEQFYIDHNDKLIQKQDSILYGDNQNSFTGTLDETICLIAGYVKNKNGQISDVAKELKKCNYAEANWRLRAFAYTMMGDSYIEQNKLDSAIICLAYADTIQWKQVDRMRKIAYIADKAERPEVAIEYYSKLINRDKPHKIKYTEKRGDQYYKIKDLKKAQEDYKEVKVLQPGNIEVNQKYEKIERDIQTNNRYINANRNNIHDPNTRYEVADRLLQNGATLNAQAVLSANRAANLPVKEQALLMETQLRTGQISSSIISNELKLSNPRLKVERKIN